MICFITDIREGEIDILTTSAKAEILRIESLEGCLIAEMKAPRSGWTHSALVAVAEKLKADTKTGAEAYLGAMWVGSTEA